MLSNNKNILLLTYENRSSINLSDNVGGVITACKRILNAHQNIECSLFTYRYTDIGKKNKLLLPLRLVIDLILMLKKTNKKDFAYCITDPSSFIRTIIYIFIAKIFFKKCSFFVDIRGGGPAVRLENNSFNIKQTGLKLIYKISDKVILQTPNFSKIPNKLRSKAFFLPNTLPSINSNSLIYSNNNKYPINSNRFSKAKMKIIYSGRIHESKGIMLILKLLDTEISEFLEIGFVGPIELKDKSKKLFLKSISKKLINYHGLIKDKSKLLNILLNYDLFVFPSFHKTEGMPNAILDAILTKLPILTTKCGFISDLFSEKHLTFIDDLNINNLVLSIENVIENYGKYISKADMAYQFTIKNYTFTNYQTKLKSLYSFFSN